MQNQDILTVIEGQDDGQVATHDIVPTHLVVKAMRDNGYKNAAYAIAELMDNSIQARASVVELLCWEEDTLVNERMRRRIKEIGVLDNGDGMSGETLRMALQFGNGTHLEPENQKGIGRFGMGLPNSSISQARRVDVWSWQDGTENALHSYLDIDEIRERRQKEVPEPSRRSLPTVWKKSGESFGKSGTLVVWSKIDRCLWRTANSIIDNSEFLIGRMYRYFLAEGRVKIRFAAFEGENSVELISERLAVPNDPMYLMEKTSCPEPFNDSAMFDEWGTSTTFYIRFRGEDHPVQLRFSLAKESARIGFGQAAGAEPHGKHAARNVGVSLVRAGRELDLDSTWSNPSEPRDRWWGVELMFEPALDDLFGVTNNKQSARNFTELAKVNLESLLEDGQTLEILKAELSADEDPRLPLIQIANRIRKNINSMSSLIRAQTERSKPTKRHEGGLAEQRATEVTRLRQQEGYRGESDNQESAPADQRQEEIVTELVSEGVAQQVAETIAATTIGESLKYTFADANLSSPAFFDVKSRGGSLIITLNVNHPAFEHLTQILEEDTSEMSSEDLRTKFVSAQDGLKLVLMAWARYEDELPDGALRDRARDARWDWGRIARDFLQTMDSN